MRRKEAAILKSSLKGEKFLDLGCGTGYYLKNGFVGFDISHNMLLQAKKKGNHFLVLGNADNLPFKDSTFDSVISMFGVLNHVDLNRCIKEVNRVLKTNGVFIFSIANLYALPWMIKTLRKRGFNFLKKQMQKKAGKIRIRMGDRKFSVMTKYHSANDIKKSTRNLFKISFFQGMFVFYSPIYKDKVKYGLKNKFMEKIDSFFSKYFPFNRLGTYILVVCRKI